MFEGDDEIADLKEEALAGDVDAQFRLGFIFEFGIDLTTEVDRDKAIEWYGRAAENGHTVAQSNLGYFYRQRSLIGSEADDFQAMVNSEEEVPGSVFEEWDAKVYEWDRLAAKWFKRAALKGDLMAQSSLGIMYREGQGVETDETEAAKWLFKAADQNDAESQRILGYMHENGEGVIQDFVTAHMYYNLSAAQGEEGANKDRDLIAEKMTQEQISTAQKNAREWKYKTED